MSDLVLYQAGNALSLVKRGRFFAADTVRTNVTRNLFEDDDMKDCIREAYVELLGKASKANSGITRVKLPVSSVANDEFYTLPLIYDIEEIWVNYDGEDISTASNPNERSISRLGPKNPYPEQRQYLAPSGQVATTPFYTTNSGGTMDAPVVKIGIYPIIEVTGSNNIIIIYRESVESPLPNDASKTIFPRRWDTLVCMKAGLMARIAFGIDVGDLRERVVSKEIEFMEWATTFADDPHAQIDFDGNPMDDPHTALFNFGVET